MPVPPNSHQQSGSGGSAGKTPRPPRSEDPREAWGSAEPGCGEVVVMAASPPFPRTHNTLPSVCGVVG